MIAKIDRAYIAGLFDGEGHVQYKQYMRQRKHNKRPYPTWSIRMEMAMTDKSILIWVHEMLGVGTVTEKRYYVTTKFEKYGTYTIMARSKEHAIQMWKDGDWNFDDYESDYGEYNEVIDDVEEEVFADTQLSLSGVF